MHLTHFLLRAAALRLLLNCLLAAPICLPAGGGGGAAAGGGGGSQEGGGRAQVSRFSCCTGSCSWLALCCCCAGTGRGGGWGATIAHGSVASATLAGVQSSVQRKWIWCCKARIRPAHPQALHACMPCRIADLLLTCTQLPVLTSQEAREGRAARAAEARGQAADG